MARSSPERVFADEGADEGPDWPLAALVAALDCDFALGDLLDAPLEELHWRWRSYSVAGTL